MGNREERGKQDDVLVKLRKRKKAAGDDPLGVGGGGGEHPTDRCGTRRVTLTGINQVVAGALTVGSRLGWDTQDGRVVVVAADRVLGFFSEQDAALLMHCVSLYHRYSMVWEGNATVLVHKEA